jgi:hypothetical protein
LTRAPYAYVGDDPLNAVDPLGLAELEDPVGGDAAGEPVDTDVTDPSRSGDFWAGSPAADPATQAAEAASEVSTIQSEVDSGECPETINGYLDRLSRSGQAPDKNGLTRAGYEYQKHMGRGELPQVRGQLLNEAGQRLLDEILTNPDTVFGDVTSGNAKGGIRAILPNGVGVTFNPDGSMAYFGLGY